MPDQKSSYRQIVKATSIFGGVQVFGILVTIVRSKIIAVLLGPLGMGIAGLLNSSIGLVSGLTNFGLSTSAVKDISLAHASGNEVRVSIVVTVIKRLVWITGLLGSLLTILFSSQLSQITFGNREYTWSFILISVVLLINQISNGQSILLRGMRMIGYMAKSGISGNVLGLIITIPIYYFFGIKGIVPGIILTSVVMLLSTWYYSRKISYRPIVVSNLRTFAEGKGMLKMGFLISISSLITIGGAYLVRIYISAKGGVEAVGLYTAGFALINTYVGMIFTAMSTDFYPRLSGVSHSNEMSKTVISQQAEIAILIIVPVIIFFLIFINHIVLILYSEKFVPISEMILYSSLGMLFKAASWPIAFLMLAKGDTKVFFWSEIVANAYILLFNILGYKYYGLTGLGMAFLAGYFIYLIQVYFIGSKKYQFMYSIDFYKVFLLQSSLAFTCFFLVLFAPKPYSYIIGSLLLTISSAFAYMELEKRLGLNSAFKTTWSKIFRK